VEICRILHKHGIPSTLGKFSKDGDDPTEIIHEYQLASDCLKDHFAADRFYLSLKPPALQFNRDFVKAIANTALENGEGILFDSHDHILAEPTIQLLKDIMDQTGSANETDGKWLYGLALPSRWRRSFADARWAAKNGVRIRLVKGEFRATSSAGGMEPKRGFLELVDRLAGSVPEVRALHNLSKIS
jgi:hypothetical protein